MGTENIVLMRNARASLQGRWGLAIGTFLIYMLIVGGIQVVPILGTIATLVISGPFALGIAIFALALSREQDAEVGQIFQGFNNFGTALGAYLLMGIFTFLWSLLLIIPGIIAAISYSMTFYIIADNEDIEVMAAIDKSKQMMYGYKWKFFRMGLRFFAWSLLCILTLGIGFLWLIPYMQVSTAKFYEDIKREPSTDEDFTVPVLKD